MARLDALRRLIGDAEFRRLADKFIGDLSRRIAALEPLGRAGERASIAREAHSLRGTAGSYGLETVAAQAARLEAACADAASLEIGAILAALDEAMATSVARLTEHFELEPRP